MKISANLINALNESVITEKINKDNAEINNKIMQSLTHKGQARKHEPELAKHGITVDYSPTQGTRLTGPNGKRLSQDKHDVHGPTRPGFAGTHKKHDKWDADRAQYYTKRANDLAAEIETLEKMERDDIIRKYNDLSTDSALAKHAETINTLKTHLDKLRADADYAAKNDIKNYRREKNERRMGHDNGYAIVGDSKVSKERPYSYRSDDVKPSPAEKVDYLNYLTKNDTGYRQDNDSDYYWGKSKSKYDPATSMNARLNGYRKLKDKNDYAQKDLAFQNKYYGVKSDDELAKDAEEIRARAEKDIQANIDKNERNKVNTKAAQDRVDATRKDIDDYMAKAREERKAKTN